MKNAAGKRIIDANGLFGSVSTAIREFCVPISGQGLINYSCDRMNLVPSSTIYCHGQPGATGYQFWWHDPHGSYSRRILMPSNHMQPNNVVTLPIPLNMDLNVRVRALVGGNYTAFGYACRARVNSPGGGGGVSQEGGYNSMLFDEGTNATFSLYPNPTREDVVYLMIEGLEEQEKSVTIDVFDMFGKRVHAEQFALAGDVLNHVLELDGSLAMGMYMVNVTIDGHMYTKRLIRQ